MNPLRAREATFITLTLCALIGLGRSAPAGTAPASTAPASTAPTTRASLVGAWRLVRIEVTGPDGPMADSFYGEGCSGMLIYDASGWMSVQIMGQPRPAMATPASRPTRNDSLKEARLKAQVLDTYYAYIARWDYEETTSMVTHHIKTSLIPGEAGLSYSQRVTFESGDLVFSTREKLAHGEAVQRKVWRRAPEN